MRVLHVTPYFAPAFRYGGPPRSIFGLCRALTEAGVEVEVFTTTANGPEPLAAAPEGTEYQGVRVRYFPLAWPRRYWRASGLAAALERALPSADLVHVHGLWNMTGSAAVGRARSRRPAIRHLAARDAAAGGDARHRAVKAAAYWASERAHVSGAAFLHATSLVEQQQIANYGPPVVTIANGVTPVAVAPGAVEEFRKRAQIDAGDEVLLCLGRLHPIKRLDLATIRAAILPSRRSRVSIAARLRPTG